MDKDIESLVNSCANCLSIGPDPKRDDLHPWDWSERPCHRIHVDYAGSVGKDYCLKNTVPSSARKKHSH